MDVLVSGMADTDEDIRATAGWALKNVVSPMENRIQAMKVGLVPLAVESLSDEIEAVQVGE